MKVKELINLLRKMPQHLDVYYSHGDNSEYEIAGDIFGADHMIKSDFNPQNDPGACVEMINDNPEEWVIIRG